MDSDDYARLQEIVNEALALGPEERPRYLSEACADRASLRRRAELMLGFADDAAGQFSDEEVSARRSLFESILEDSCLSTDGWVPEQIAGYRIRRVIGRGGTGVVFEAEQQRPARLVAVKLLHPALASPENIARLGKEADALGRFQHAGIAQIYEASSFDTGAGVQPFLVMEIVDGLELTRYADAAHLDARQRVELLAQICDAVEHAHERGVVHRDLKPENVLVTADGQPKLLDFGIASLARDRSIISDGLTVDGQILGTVAYMAPEQAAPSKSMLSSKRSGGRHEPLMDVYSLGAIGFELVTGRSPRQLDGLSLTQVLEQVTMRDVPPARSVKPSLDVDVETILAKALEAEPGARYASAAALAADLRRYLGDELIAARPHSKVYRAVKFTRRHRAIVVGTAATMGAMLVGLIVSLALAAKAKRAESEIRSKFYAAEMMVATSSSMDPVTRTRSIRFVERWRDERRLIGWEWHLLDSVRRRRVVVLDTPEPPMAIDWHPGGEVLAVAMTGSLGLFDPTTGEALEQLALDPNAGITLLTGLGWDPGGERVAASGLGGIACWSFLDGEVGGAPQWTHPEVFAHDVSWHPSGHTLVYTGTELVSLDASTGSLIQTTVSDTGSNFVPLCGQILDSAGERIYAYDNRGRTMIWTYPEHTPIVSVPETINVITGVDWSPDDQRLALAGSDWSVRIVDLASGEQSLLIQEHEEATFGLDWHPAGDRIAVASEDGTVRVFDATSGATSETYLWHESTVAEVRWSPDGKRLASVALNGEVLVWDAEERSAFRRHSDKRLANIHGRMRLAWNDREMCLRASIVGRTVKIEVRDDSATTFCTHPGRPSFAQGSRWLAASDGAKALAIVDMHSDEVIETLYLGDDAFLFHDWRADSNVLLAASRDGLWRVEPGLDGVVDQTRIADVGVQVDCLRCSPSGRRVAYTTTDSRIRVHDAHSGEVFREFRLDSGADAASLAWSPDGRSIVVACADSAVRIASLEDGTLHAPMLGHSNSVEGVAWHPSGKRIASGGRDRTVKLWDPVTGDLVGSLGCRARVADVSWIDSGRSLAAVDIEGTIYVWDASRSIDDAVRPGRRQ